MALTRKMLKAMGIEDEKIDQIIEEHAESVDALKAQRDELKEAAGKADGYKKELDALKAKGEGAGEYEEKYKAKCKELDDYKAKVDGEKAAAEKRSLYRELLKSAGVDPKRIETVLKVSDLENVTVKDGAIEGADKLTEGIKADFIATTTVKGADVAHAPKGEGGKDINEMSTAEYMKYKAEQRG